jgi:hypothetical protein
MDQNGCSRCSGIGVHDGPEYANPLAPQDWSSKQVAEHWLLAYSDRYSNPKFAKQRELKKQAIMADKKKLKVYRD